MYHRQRKVRKIWGIVLVCYGDECLWGESRWGCKCFSHCHRVEFQMLSAIFWQFRDHSSTVCSLIWFLPWSDVASVTQSAQNLGLCFRMLYGDECLWGENRWGCKCFLHCHRIECLLANQSRTCSCPPPSILYGGMIITGDVVVLTLFDLRVAVAGLVSGSINAGATR